MVRGGPLPAAAPSSHVPGVFERHKVVGEETAVPLSLAVVAPHHAHVDVGDLESVGTGRNGGAKVRVASELVAVRGRELGRGARGLARCRSLTGASRA